MILSEHDLAHILSFSVGSSSNELVVCVGSLEKCDLSPILLKRNICSVETVQSQLTLSCIVEVILGQTCRASVSSGSFLFLEYHMRARNMGRIRNLLFL